MISEFWVHSVTVKPKLGEGSYGPVFGDPLSVMCFVDENQRLVRDSEGSEVVSTTSIYTDNSHVESFKVGSEVTLPTGDTTSVLAANNRTSGPLGLPDHLEVNLE